jgi:hypothetical protein
VKRRRLRDRRGSELLDLVFRGRRYIVGVSRYPQNGALAEIFIDSERSSTDAADDARDAALTLSLALQCGADPQVIRCAVARDNDGNPAGIVGAVLDLLLDDETGHASGDSVSDRADGVD